MSLNYFVSFSASNKGKHCAHSGRGNPLSILSNSSCINSILSKFDRVSGRFISVAAHWANSDTEIRDIDEDASGNIWISTIRQGVVLYDPAKNFGYSLLNEESQPGVFF